MVKTKRFIEPYEMSDGFRIFVDAIYPKKIPEKKRRIDLYFHEVAPSWRPLLATATNPEKRWNSFLTRYNGEINRIPEKKKAFYSLRKLIKSYEDVTLVYTESDKKHNTATALLELIRRANAALAKRKEKKLKDTQKMQSPLSKNKR